MARTYHIFDLVIVGAGTAGIAALREALKYTTNVVLVEKGVGGTTCARTGCMPAKALIHAARLYESRRRFPDAGIQGGDGLTVDIPRVLRQVRKLRDHFVRGVHEDLENIGHYIVQGAAKFETPTCLRVDGKLYHTRQTIIATGATPVVPKAFEGIPKKRLLTSDNLFEQRSLPKRMGIVGLGPLGLEMAQALAFLGCEVVAAHRGDTLGGLTDTRMNEELREVLASSMTVHMQAEAQAEMEGENISFRAGGQSYEVDALFLGTGRRPTTEGLCLQRLKVPLKDSGTPWYDPMTLQVPGLPVFFAGDVSGGRAVLHEVATQGKIAAYNACHAEGGEKRISRYVPLSIIFTEPTIATVGAGGDDLRGRNVIRAEAGFAHQGRALIEQRNEGRILLFLDPEDTALLGAELLAPEGEHLAHLLALAMQQRLTARDMLKMPFYHPTLEEGLRTALKQGVKAAVK